MTYLLTTLGPQLHENIYPTDFAATQFRSIEDGTGSVYIYRPLKGPADFYRGPNVQPGLRVQPMLFSGCIVNLAVEVRLAASKSSNNHPLKGTQPLF
jgi:hypothetical protein